MVFKSAFVRVELTDLTFVENLDTPRIRSSVRFTTRMKPFPRHFGRGDTGSTLKATGATAARLTTVAYMSLPNLSNWRGALICAVRCALFVTDETIPKVCAARISTVGELACGCVG